MESWGKQSLKWTFNYSFAALEIHLSRAGLFKTPMYGLLSVNLKSLNCNLLIITDYSVQCDVRVPSDSSDLIIKYSSASLWSIRHHAAIPSPLSETRTRIAWNLLVYILFRLAHKAEKNYINQMWCLRSFFIYIFSSHTVGVMSALRVYSKSLLCTDFCCDC